MLSQTTLQADIKKILTDFQGNKNIDSNTAIDNFSSALSSAIDKYVKAADVNIVNVPVATTGTAAAQTGLANGTGTLS